MKIYRFLTLIAGVLITAFAALIFVVASSTAHAATPPEPCDMSLSVVLTPDVPNPDDVGFLSSLLSNRVDYRLTLQRQDDPSVVVLDLTGPGPDYRCQDVVETMRRDGRVLSVHVDSGETQTVSVVTAAVRPAEEPEAKSNLHVSRAGIGSLYWAAHNPAQAWRAVFPVLPGDPTDAYEDIRARCAFVTNQPSGRAVCP